MAEIDKQIQIGSAIASAPPWTSVENGQINDKDLKANFQPPYYLQTPAVVTTFQKIDLGNPHQATWRAMVQTLQPTPGSSSLQVGTWADSRLYAASIQWMAIPSSNPDFQSGTIAIPSGGSNNRVTFPKPFTSQPQVFYTFNRIDISTIWHLNMNVNTITTRGFNYEVRPVGDAIMTSAGISWVAFTGNLPEVGVYTVQPKAKNKTESFKGSITFDKSFFHAPKVFIGLSKMHITDQTIRFELKVYNVTPTGMNWEVITWGDTTVQELRLTFLVIGEV